MADLKGFGGVFLYANDATALRDWYVTHFGLSFASYNKDKVHYLSFAAGDLDHPGAKVFTVFSIFQAEEPLAEGRREYRVNFRIEDAAGLREKLEKAGIQLEPLEEHQEGKFFWARDPEGNRLEFWEPGDVSGF